MYTLVSQPFLEQGCAVAIVGYRTYPDGRVAQQVEDCNLAAAKLAKDFPHLCQHVTLMGHSSGAHIAFLMLVDQVRSGMDEPIQEKRHQSVTYDMTPQARTTKLPFQIDSFVGLSGPYDISHHFDYEAARGVEELSPMKPVCGNTRQAFRWNSPALRLVDALAELEYHECDNPRLDEIMPHILLVHGIEDETVPFTSTGEAARILRACGITKCQEMYVAETAHQDTCMQIMLGGRTRKAIIDWMKGLPSSAPSNHPQLLAASKL